MSNQPEHPDTRTDPRAASERSPDALTNGAAARSADLEEDRRRQRELDDAELGGEA